MALSDFEDGKKKKKKGGLSEWFNSLLEPKGKKQLDIIAPTEEVANASRPITEPRAKNQLDMLDEEDKKKKAKR